MSLLRSQRRPIFLLLQRLPLRPQRESPAVALAPHRARPLHRCGRAQRFVCNASGWARAAQRTAPHQASASRCCTAMCLRWPARTRSACVRFKTSNALRRVNQRQDRSSSWRLPSTTQPLRHGTSVRSMPRAQSWSRCGRARATPAVSSSQSVMANVTGRDLCRTPPATRAPGRVSRRWGRWP